MKLGTCQVSDKMQHLNLWSTLEPDQHMVVRSDSVSLLGKVVLEIIFFVGKCKYNIFKII